MLSMMLISLVGIIWSDRLQQTGGVAWCGSPGSPAFGRPHPIKERYLPGEGVSYSCNSGYALQGTPYRTCTPQGMWEGQMPLCDRSLSTVELQASSRQTLLLYPAQMVLDGDPRTCTYTDKVRPRFIRVDMRTEHRVKAVSLTVPTDIYSHDAAQITIYAISVRGSTTASTTASYHKCATFNGKFASRTLRLKCGGGGVEGRYIHVEDDRRRVDYFSLCEIDIFVHRDTYECGESEVPAHAYSVRTDTGAMTYRCLYGYRLEGPSSRVCQDSGQWSPSVQPTCTEITCPSLAGVEHGRLQHAGGFRLGATANLTCDYGFESGPVRTLSCSEDGQWSPAPHALSCQPVECGPPPARHPSDQFVLLNGTRYGAVALFSCSRPISISTNEQQEEAVHCREDGQWSTPTFDCSLTEDSGLSRLGLIEDEQGDVPTGAVIGMAVIVFFLLVVVILVLLLKRRKVLLQSSSESLPHKEKESAPPPPHQPSSIDNDAFYATIPPASDSQKPRPLLSTVLFPNHWRRKKSGSSSKDSGHSSSSGNGCIYEEVGGVITEGGNAMNEAVQSRGEAVYAQVDLEEKRRSRLNKTLVERFEPVDPPKWEGAYRSEGAYDEVDLEPIKLRELPPIPTEEGVTYASLALPLDPPTVMKDNELYQANVTSA